MAQIFHLIYDFLLSHSIFHTKAIPTTKKINYALRDKWNGIHVNYNLCPSLFTQIQLTETLCREKKIV